MITDIPINESHIYAFKVSGKLIEEDYKTFRPKLDRLVKKHSPLSLLIELKDFDGWSAKAAWEDIKLGFEHSNDFLRIAIVGESTIEKIITSFGDLFMDAEVKYFDDNAEALDWLKEVSNKAEANEYKGYRHILVASDFSRYSSAALLKATELAAPFDAKITLIHASEYLSAGTYPYTGELAVPVMVDNPEMLEKQKLRIKKHLVKQVEDNNLSNDVIETLVIFDHPVDAIIEFSNHHNIDLIVMGSHGRRGIARLLGSSTHGVVNHASCDVLMVS